MTPDEWNDCADPLAMIEEIAGRDMHQALWSFTLASALRIRDELPGAAYRRVVDVASLAAAPQATWREVDLALATAGEALSRLEARLVRSNEPQEQERLKRQLLLCRAVFAFNCETSSEAAAFISHHLLGWAHDPSEEARIQAEALRGLVPDPA